MDVKTTLQWASPVTLGVFVGLFVLALAGFAVLRWGAGRPIALARRRALLAIRVLILAIIALILFNPVRVGVTPGTIERPKVVYLVDTSQSMALGQKATRWEQVTKTIRATEKLRNAATGAQVSVFRFGSKLAAVAAPPWLGGGPSTGTSVGSQQGEGVAQAATVPPTTELPLAPNDSDTLLIGSLEGLAGRFGQVPPQAVVVFSDGRARDPDHAEAIARGYGRMQVPIHVVPVGDLDVGGDVAIVSLVAPPQVRKNSRVAAQVFLRSYGYKGKRVELKLVAAAPAGSGSTGPVLARTPVILQEGIMGATLAFDSGEEDRRIEARIDSQPGEVSTENNTFAADIAIDHTKIRILYLEGASDRFIARTQAPRQGIASMIRGAYSALQEALMEDPDIECTAVIPAGVGGDFSVLTRIGEPARGLPESPSELFAYDAIILSNVPREILSDQQLGWVDEWIKRRGGGLCMVGGPNSFASGRWTGTAVGEMLPVELLPEGSDSEWTLTPTTIEPVTSFAGHPIWHLVADDTKNRALLKSVPPFMGSNPLGRVKPGADLLAEVVGTERAPVAAIVAQPYGRGRTLAMSTAITTRWASGFTQTWGEGDARYFKKFTRNLVHWLTENSSIGRRRLLAETDKRLYRPGEPIVIRARTFDENASVTLDYRVATSVEPASADNVTSDDSPLRRPGGVPSPASTTEAPRGPLLPWGEEFNLTREVAEKSYTTILPIAEAKSLPPGTTLARGLRIELTAYEGSTQVDSTALDVQILDDPSEQQNPMPDHDLLRRIAGWSGGKVLNGAAELSATLGRIPTVIGPPEIKKVPAWSRWWLLLLLILLLTIEWIWRRRLGLA